MNAKDYNNLDVDLTDVAPVYLPMIKNLVNEKADTRKDARYKLVSKGAVVLPSMYSLFVSKNELLRWEASKIIEELASPESIPFLISLLSAPEADIRWIAAEGLINIGRLSIMPLLKEMKKQHEVRFYLITGAHHVLNELFTKDEKEKFGELLDVLKERKGMQVSIPFLVRKTLKDGAFGG